MTFGEKLKLYRKMKNITQRDLAKIAGLGFNTISNYERGQTYPQNREIYARLAQILEIDTDFLHNENDDFINEAEARYGKRGRSQAEQLVEDARGLFAGGELTEEEKLGVLRALQDVFWECKDANSAKYSSKNEE